MKQYQIKISKWFTALENLHDSEDIHRVGKTLRRISKPNLRRI